MKSLFTSFWFWLFLIGIVIILTALLIGGGMKKFTGWIWAIFIIGVVLGLLGIIFAFYEWNSSKEYIFEEKFETQNSLIDKEYDIKTTTTSPNSPNSSTFPNSPMSPMKSPTLIRSNIPQAERGFATSSIDISALSPKE